MASPPSAHREAVAGPLPALVLILVLLASWGGLPGRGEAAERCRPTPADMEGPFYVPGAPERIATGSGYIVTGRVLGAPDCRSLPGARVEWWHADPSGKYDEAHRGSQNVGPDGSYRFETDFPGRYAGRPPHIHFKVFAPGYRTLTTQLYPRGRPGDTTFTIVLEPRE